MAVDTGGDVFVSDLTNSRVLELSPGGVQQTVPFTGLSGPEGLAMNWQGDLFVADTGNNRVLELSPDGTQQTLPFSGLREPTGVAVDSPWPSCSSRPIRTAAYWSWHREAPSRPCGIDQIDRPDEGVAVDSAGDVFVAAVLVA